MITNPDFKQARPAGTGGASDLGLYGAAPVALVAPALLLPSGSAPAQGVALSSPSPNSPSSTVTGSGSEPAMWWSFATEAASVVAAQALPAITKVGAPEPPVKDGASGAKEVAAAHVGSAAPTVMWPTSPPEQAETQAGPPTPSVPLPESIPPTVNADQPSAPVPQSAEVVLAAANEAVASLEERLATLEEFVGGGLETVTGAVRDVAETAAQQIHSAQENAANALESLASTATSNIDAFAEIVADTTDSLSTTVSRSVSELGETVDSTATELIESSTSLPVTTPQVFDLGPVGGSDPAGGVATLVGMISAADMFGLADIGAEPEAPPVALIGAVEGTLADLAPADVLLASHDPHEGALGLLSDLIDGHG